MKVFISHAAEDRPLAKVLSAQLEEEGLEVWSLDQIEPGENWALRAGKELGRADVIVFLLTSAGALSEYVRHDFEFVVTEYRYKNRVLTALLDDAAEQHVPWILKKLPCVKTEPTEAGLKKVTEAVASLIERIACHAE